MKHLSAAFFLLFFSIGARADAPMTPIQQDQSAQAACDLDETMTPDANVSPHHCHKRCHERHRWCKSECHHHHHHGCVDRCDHRLHRCLEHCGH
jgi:hypothetical protein